MLTMPSRTNDDVFTMPELHDIETIKVGDLAPDAFGRLCSVVSIDYRGVDIGGQAYVGYSTTFGPRSTMTMSMKEREIVRHANLRSLAAEIRAYEQEMRKKIEGGKINN